MKETISKIQMQDAAESRAAVDAMAALQKRIADLEQEIGGLRCETAKLRSLADETERSVNQKNEFISMEADKTHKMLQSASETLIELRRIQAENRQLQTQWDKLNDQIKKKELFRKQDHDKVIGEQNEAEHAELLEKEIEELFSLLLTPPEYPKTTSKNVIFNPTITSITTYSLPATIQTVISYLQSLPIPFREQKYKTKMEIVTTLFNARNMCCKLMSDINQLEMQKNKTTAKKKLQKDIDTKFSYLKILSQAMSKFAIC